MMGRYDRRLARAVYAMVLVAVFTMVWPTEEYVYFAVACLAALVSWPIAHGQARPTVLPRWLISLAVLLALGFFLLELADGKPLINSLAHFMVFVQVCKLFETKRSRDYGQLIVLSMLEMVVAAILSSSLLFGLLLTGYLALSIYTLLLFHFKREMELFESASGRPRTGQRPGGRSMAHRPARRSGWRCPPAPGALVGAARALDGLGAGRFWRISATSGAFALAVGMLLFVAFPRVGEGLMLRFRQPAARPMTGFSPYTRLGEIGRIKESDQIAMRVAVLKDGKPVRAGPPLLLRGSVMTRYRNGEWQADPPPQRWARNLAPGAAWLLNSRRLDSDAGIRQLQIAVEPSDVQCLFSTYPPVRVLNESKHFLRIAHDPTTDTLQSPGLPVHGLRYSVWAPADEEAADRLVGDNKPRFDLIDAADLPLLGELAGEWVKDLPRRDWPAAIARCLQERCRYSLEMRRSADNADPLEDFLFNTRSGHCEYFASAMVVLCQKVGLFARLVNGFKAVEYSDQGDGYYIVRQRYAHSWVEVFQEEGRGDGPGNAPGRGEWVTYDPTPGAEDDGFQTPVGLEAWSSHLLDYLNYQWQQNVVNYSGRDRAALLARAETTVGGLRAGAGNVWRWIVRAFFRGLDAPWSAGRAAKAVLLLGAVGLAGVVLYRAARPRKGRRGQRPRQEAFGFWGELLELLARRRVAVPVALTPLEIARSLADCLSIPDSAAGRPDPAGLTASAVLPALAVAYYKVRYGGGALSADEQASARAALTALAACDRDRIRMSFRSAR